MHHTKKSLWFNKGESLGEKRMGVVQFHNGGWWWDKNLQTHEDIYKKTLWPLFMDGVQLPQG